MYTKDILPQIFFCIILIGISIFYSLFTFDVSFISVFFIHIFLQIAIDYWLYWQEVYYAQEGLSIGHLY